MPNLSNINIKFHTYNDDLNDDTDLHIFVKNRRAPKPRSDTASTSLGPTSFISNQLAWEAATADGDSEFNPFLGRLLNAAGGNTFGNDSDHEVNIAPREMIPLEEVVLPVVNIHILPNGSDQWIFDYTISFTFDNGQSFSASSNVNGVTGIILDEKNKDYAGICIENPFIPLPVAPQPDTAAVLDRVLLEFSTHDEGKDNDTVINIHVVNRLSATESTDISVALDVLSGQEFSDPSKFSVELPLASTDILLKDIVLPVVNINIVPNGNDRWNFDYRISYFFKDPGAAVPGVFRQPYSSTTSGVILDQDHHKHTGAYSGNSFPTLNVPAAPLTPLVIDHFTKAKSIPLSFLQSKINDFINDREADPLKIIRLDNSGSFGDAMPASYVDLKSIDADPPPPRSVEPLDYHMGVTYDSSPTDLNQIRASDGFGDLYFQDINSDNITITLNADSVTPFEVLVTFETDGPDETVGGNSRSVSGMNFSSFFIRILLTLRFVPRTGLVDLMGWVDDINGLLPTPLPNNLVRVTGSFLGEPIDTTMAASAFENYKSDLMGQVLHVGIQASSDFAGSLQKNMREQLFTKLSKPDAMTLVSARDSLNATANSWFMGGVIQHGHSGPVAYPNANSLTGAVVQNGNLDLTYTGPPFSFVYQQPSDWPTENAPNPSIDFSPGTLENIDHIVVLTMENRSFDHMLGYLSLPEVMGGLNRQDADGLKGSEVNMLDGLPCRIFRFEAGETIFTPDPPHDTEPAIQAINGGRMDGFAQNYADLRGKIMGPNIMGYHTADTVPVYDGLARDFAIGHRWFAPHPGPTFCNRFYELTGRLNIDPWGFWEYSNSSPLLPVFTDTIFDHLTKNGVSWTYFENHYCFLRFFERHTYDTTNISSFTDPEFGFVNMARTGNLPSVSFIDPHFVELPPDGNCDGPPADVKEGQKLVKSIVEAVIASPKWDKTLLIVTYDEHGGFYDHVAPSPAEKVSPELLGTHGVRVPIFIITPWVKNGSVFGHDGLFRGIGGEVISTVGTAAQVSTHPPEQVDPSKALSVEPIPAPIISRFQSLHFDHTSILKTIARRFMSANPPYMGARYAAAHDLSEVLTNTAQNNQFRPFIAYNLAYDKLNLTVQGGSLVLNATDSAPDQDFRFEDAGDGFFYIRTLGNLYLTVEVPSGAPTGPGTTLSVVAAAKQSPASDMQRWKLASNSITVLNKAFTVSCAAFPDKALQPTGNVASAGAQMTVADRAHSLPMQTPNPWGVTSPLLGSGQIVAEA